MTIDINDLTLKQIKELFEQIKSLQTTVDSQLAAARCRSRGRHVKRATISTEDADLLAARISASVTGPNRIFMSQRQLADEAGITEQYVTNAKRPGLGSKQDCPQYARDLIDETLKKHGF